MGYKDKDKQRAYTNTYYARNAGKRRKQIKAYQQKRHEEIRKMKESTPCADCHVQYPYYVMDFDHRKNKCFNVSQAMRNTGWLKTLEEIAKCDIVCANCHRIRTHKNMA